MKIIERRRRLIVSTSRTFHLTLIGAMNDVITIKDSGGNTVGTCTFPSGATQGTIDVIGNSSELYTFTSSIAKDTTSGTSAYSKQMYLSDDDMKVMPDGALYWYGNECINITGGWVSGGQAWGYSGSGGQAPTLTKNADNMYGYLNPSASNKMGHIRTSNALNLTGKTKMKIDSKFERNASSVVNAYFGVMDNYTLNYMDNTTIQKSVYQGFDSGETLLVKDNLFMLNIAETMPMSAVYPHIYFRGFNANQWIKTTIRRIWLE